MPASFAGYTTMQEITRTKCNSIANGTEGRLRDTRDNKWYWVAKLDDGLCWMTQNLDYDGGGSASFGFSSTDRSPSYYNPGIFYYTKPTVTTGGCATTNPAECKGVTSIDVANLSSEWTPTDSLNFIEADAFVGTDRITICSKEANSYIAYNNDLAACKVYYYTAPQLLTHYALGNYYNWYAATNGGGTDSSTSGTSIDSSVCPEGWKLPLGTTSIGSFSSIINDHTSITEPPYFFDSGDIYGGRVQGVGSAGGYWSATVASSGSNGKAYFLRLVGLNDLDPRSNYYGEYYRGNSVRCVAR